MKKIICFTIALSLVFVLYSCANNEKDDVTTTSTTQSTTETTTEDYTDPARTTQVAVTRVIYPVLKKDSSASFSHSMVSFTSKYNPNETNRTHNLMLACAAIDNIVLQPGDVFSYNQVVGKRTEARGYRSAKVVVNNAFEDGLGGGVCQVSSTLFNAVLLSNLEIVERSNHSLKVTYVPTGRDATVQWNYLDFQFKNNYDFPIKLKMSCKNGTMVAEILSQQNVELPKITLDVQTQGDVFTLTRSANGTVNFITKSSYSAPVTTTAPPAPTSAPEPPSAEVPGGEGEAPAQGNAEPPAAE